MPREFGHKSPRARPKGGNFPAAVEIPTREVNQTARGNCVELVRRITSVATSSAN